MSFDKKDIPVTREPPDDIMCKDCKHRMKPITIRGQVYKRYKYDKCAVFDYKPNGVLWKKEKCDLYQKEESS